MAPASLPRTLRNQWRLAVRHARHRRQLGIIPVEGHKALAEALQAGLAPIAVVAAHANLPGQLPPDVPHYVSPADLARITSTSTPPPIAALFRMPDAPPQPAEVRRTVVLDHIQHPGNAGAIVRTAFWFGIDHLIFLGGIDPWHPRLITGSAGAIFRISWQRFTDETPLRQFLQQQGLTTVGADMKGTPLHRMAAPARFALVVGNEGHGLASHWDEALHHRIRIPACQPFESLNVAVATAIILYEWRPC